MRQIWADRHHSADRGGIREQTRKLDKEHRTGSRLGRVKGISVTIWERTGLTVKCLPKRLALHCIRWCHGVLASDIH